MEPRHQMSVIYLWSILFERIAASWLRAHVSAKIPAV